VDEKANAMLDISIEPLRTEEIQQSCELVERVFHDNVAQLFSDEGVKEFMKYCTVDEMTKRMELGAVSMAARSAGRMVGLAHVVDLSHIAWFFVDTALHGKGVGRSLFDAALTAVRERNPNLKRLTVNASPNSIGFYERLGFEPTGKETMKNGIRFLPMACHVAS
jgi:GNAT superfamily N-acetyltransferase